MSLFDQSCTSIPAWPFPRDFPLASCFAPRTEFSLQLHSRINHRSSQFSRHISRSSQPPSLCNFLSALQSAELKLINRQLLHSAQSSGPETFQFSPSYCSCLRTVYIFVSDLLIYALPRRDYISSHPPGDPLPC